MTVERAGEGAAERVRGVVGDGRWSGGGCGGSLATVEWGRVRAGGRRRRPVERGRVRWVVSGGGAGEGCGGSSVAVELASGGGCGWDRDRDQKVSMKIYTVRH